MNSDINHTEEMERAYFEAYKSCQEISPIIREWDFFQFAEFIAKLNNGKIFQLSGPLNIHGEEYHE